jgi:hypothetical protein
MKKNGKTAACLWRQRGTESGSPQYFVSLCGAQLHLGMPLRANAGQGVFF